MPCGHPSSAVVQADEGTAYCGECAKSENIPALEEEERQELVDEAARELREGYAPIPRLGIRFARALLATDELLREAQMEWAEFENSPKRKLLKALQESRREVERKDRLAGELRRIFRQRMKEWVRDECKGYGEEDVEQFLLDAEHAALHPTQQEGEL